jgi:REP element-mobilizing transposase RayT
MPRYDPDKHHRRSIRLKGYDYALPGAYFVTLNTRHRELLFGEIVNGEMQLNEYGKIVQTCWHETPAHFVRVELDAFVVMPNHVNLVIFLTDHDTSGGTACRAPNSDFRKPNSRLAPDDYPFS